MQPRPIAGFSSYFDEHGGASLHWVHRVSLGSLLTTVAVQPGRCRRFIETLLARIKYARRTLRMKQRTPGSEEPKVLLSNSGTRIRSCGEQFRDRSRGNNVTKVFRFSFLRFAIFEISNFANLDFCVLSQSARPSLGDPALHPALRPAFKVRRGRRSACAAVRRHAPPIRRGTPCDFKFC